MNSDHIAVLHAQVVSNDAVYASTTIIQIIICKDNENSIPPTLALYQNGVATEELEGIHGVIRESDD